MIDTSLTEKIDAYLRQELTLEERAAFENEISRQPALAKEVEAQRLAMTILDKLEERHLQEKLAIWRADIEGKKPADFVKRNRWFLPSLALLLVASAWLYRSYTHENIAPSTTPPAAPQPPSQTPVVEPEPDTLPLRRIMACAESRIIFKPEAMLRGGSSEENLLAEVDSMLAGKRAKSMYGRAAKQLLLIPPGNELYGQAQKRLAYIRYRQGNPGAAVQAYQNYAATDPSNSEEHDWNLALYALADFPDGEAAFRKYLRSILDKPGHSHYRDAQSLKKELTALGLSFL